MIDLVNIAIQESIGNYSRQGGHYSATELIHSPRYTLLRRRYEELKPPATIDNSFASFKGNAIHNEMKRGLWSYKRKLEVLDPGQAKEMFVEYRVFDKVLGRRVTGQPDLVIEDVLFDYKTKKAWSKPYHADQMGGWEKQLNIYAFLLKQYEIAITEAYIVTIYLDWNNYMAEKNPSKYPQSEVEYIPVDIWHYEDQEQFVYSAIDSLNKCEELEDDELPDCNLDDTWERTEYKLCKVGGKRAIKKYNNKVDAYQHLAKVNGKGDYFITNSTSDPVFCRDYCYCRDKCSQWKEWGSNNG